MAAPSDQHLPPGEPDRSLRYSIWEGGAYTLMVAVTASSIRTFFASSLGATDADYSTLTAASTLATLGAVAGAHIVARAGSRKRVIMAVVWNRLLWALVAMVPFLALPPRWGLYLLMTAVLVTAFFDTLLGNAWMSWMTDLVPVARRSRYFGLRAAIHGGLAMAASWVIGHAFDYLRAPERLGPDHVFAPLFLFAAACGGISAWFMNRKWEPAAPRETPMPLPAMIRLPFMHAAFRQLILFYVLWTVVTAVATPFWQPHMINNLHMDGATIALYAIFSGVVGLASQPMWGRLIDRFGSKPVLAITIVGITFLPFFWLFATPDFLSGIWADALLTGLFWPGFNLATFNLHLHTAPRENRQAYLAAITMTVGLAGFCANLLGGWIAVACASFHAQLLGFPLVNYHLIFVASAFGRLALLPMARRLHEERSESVGTLLSVAGQRVTATLAEGLQYGVERIKRLARP